MIGVNSRDEDDWVLEVFSPVDGVDGCLSEVDAKDETDPPELADDLNCVEHDERDNRPLEPSTRLGGAPTVQPGLAGQG